MKTYLDSRGWSGFSSGRWTTSLDNVYNPSDEIIIKYNIYVDTLAGNDVISAGGGGIGRFGTGIMVQGGARLATGAGNDRIIGRSFGGTGIYNDGLISMGDGDDSIEGSGGYIGIRSNGTGIYDLGNGNNYINATGDVWGIYVNRLLSGNGKDSVRAEASQYAISAQYLDLGDGDDVIYGKGGTIATGSNQAGVGLTTNTLITGNGNDSITGINAGASGIRFGQGIWLQRSSDFIDTGAGNDTITGSSFGGWEINCGIDNSGSIRTGAGMDTIDASYGGFRGSGLFDLGSDDDTLIGFGPSSGESSNANFLGGLGTDKILLGAGRYRVSPGIGVGTYNIQMLTGSMSTSSSMRTSGFELIGSAASHLTTSLVVGTLEITQSGGLNYQ